jgi:hypothetical protein
MPFTCSAAPFSTIIASTVGINVGPDDNDRVFDGKRALVDRINGDAFSVENAGICCQADVNTDVGVIECAQYEVNRITVRNFRDTPLDPDQFVRQPVQHEIDADYGSNPVHAVSRLHDMNGLVRVHVHVGNQCTARHHFNAAGLEQIDPSIGRWSWKVLFALIIDNLEILDLESQLRVRAGSDLAQCDRLAVVFQIEKIDARIAAVDGLLPLVPDESRLSDIKVDFLEVIGRHVRQQQRDRACALARRDGVSARATTGDQKEG